VHATFSSLPRALRALFLGGMLAVALAARADTSFKPDSGRFTATVQETKLGTTTFKSDADGSSTSDTEVSMGGRSSTLHLAIKASKGRITEVTADAGPQGKYTLTIAGTKGSIAISGPGITPVTKQVALPPRFLPISNSAAYLLTHLVKAYNARKGGPQSFQAVLVDGIGPQGLIQIKVTLASKGAKPFTIGQKTVPVSRYALTLAGSTGRIDAVLMTDSDGRVLMMDVPGQKYVILRDGYRELTVSELPADPLRSRPAF
jgi:hypothetical protein